MKIKKMIEIKGIVTGWKRVNKIQAKHFVNYLKNKITNIPKENINEYINKNHLRGITIEELEK